MKSKITTKHALITSVMALFLCVAMLIGSTFAWFTDTASTGVNTIQAGTLKVDIVEAANTDNTLKGKTLKWMVNGSTSDENVLWEPNATFRTESFKIKSNGTLALKYKMSINGVTGDTQLLNVITFRVVDKSGEAVNLDNFVGHLTPTEALSEELYIEGTMDQNAGNEYQGKTMEGFGITVKATQDTVEADSTGTTYDANATYPQEFNTTTTEDYEDALATVKTAITDSSKSQNVTINVKEDISNATGVVTAENNNLSLDLGNKTVEVLKTVGSSGTETLGAQFLQGSSVTLKNGTYKFTDNNTTAMLLIQNYSNLTLDNVTLDASNVEYALSSNCGNVTIKGSTNITAKAGGTALDVMHWEGTGYETDGTHVVFEESMTGTVDGKIAVYCYNGSSRPVDDGGATLVIKGGTFKNTGLTLEQFKAFVPTGYTASEGETGVYTVKAG